MDREEMLRLADAEMQRAQEALEAQHAYEMEILKAIRQIYTPKRENSMDQQQEAWMQSLLISLRSQNSQLWEIVRAVVDADTTYRDDPGDQYCVFCCGEENYSDPAAFHHEDTCPVVKARALVEQARTGKENA